MTTQSELLKALHETAEALSRQAVRLGFVYDSPNGGYCITTKENIFCIGIDPRLPIARLYQVFLHETAHAFTAKMKLPDRERAAWEVASIWAVWIARRDPADIKELIKWLEKLKGYHEQNTNDYVFTLGDNAGWLLPMATHINRITGGG